MKDRDTLGRKFHENYSSTWPLHDIATTNIVWYMAYERGAGEGVVYAQ